MIYISQDQLEQVEYLLKQSAMGNHVLFDSASVRRIFSQDFLRPDCGDFDPKEAYEVEHHIERIILKESLAEKRAYLEGLDTSTYERVVRTYFNIVENNLYESLEVRH